jgi:hypothetical protein
MSLSFYQLNYIRWVRDIYARDVRASEIRDSAFRPS